MKLLDLYCCGGGAAMGYRRAGFDITGVDIKPQPRYPFKFIRADALQYLSQHGHKFDAIHASPPCHEYSTGTRHRKNAGIVYPDLLPPTQAALRSWSKPYVIENVPGAAKLMRNPIMLCGGMFGLGVMRHRFFESNIDLKAPEHTCNKDRIDRDLVSCTRHGPPARWYRKNPGKAFNVKIWHDAIGINWLDRTALTQAIPPAYTEWIGKRLIEHLTQ